jgi:hypothetical protein
MRLAQTLSAAVAWRRDMYGVGSLLDAILQFLDRFPRIWNSEWDRHEPHCTRAARKLFATYYSELMILGI